MTALNREAADALRPFTPNAVTDVTGFGLLGHAHEMAERSGVRIELDAAALPFFPGALEQAEAGVRTGGDRRNRDFAGPHVEADGPTEALVALAYDPQTAGGLLVSLPADKGAVARSADVRGARALPRHASAGVAEGAGVASLRRRSSRPLRNRCRPRGPVGALLALASAAISLYLIVLTGAAVRLTGSGLACESWPGCQEGAFFPAVGEHSSIEFGNRVMALFPIALSLAAWIFAYRTRGPRPLGTLARRLHLPGHDRAGAARAADDPARPASADGRHPLPARTRRARDRDRAGRRSLGERARPGRRRRCRGGFSCSVSCSREPAGSSSSRARSRPRPARIPGTAPRSSASGTCSTPSTSTCARRRRSGSRSWSCSSGSIETATGRACSRRGPGVLLVLLLVQMAVGELQWRNQLPWWLVLIHVGLAALVWACTVGLVTALWRTPRTLSR